MGRAKKEIILIRMADSDEKSGGKRDEIESGVKKHGLAHQQGETDNDTDQD